MSKFIRLNNETLINLDSVEKIYTDGKAIIVTWKSGKESKFEIKRKAVKKDPKLARYVVSEVANAIETQNIINIKEITDFEEIE